MTLHVPIEKDSFNGLLAVDPGKTVGLSLFNKEAVIVKYDQIPHDDLVDTMGDWFDEWKFSDIVVEDFKLFGHLARQQIGSKFETSQGIGQCEMFCKLNKLRFTKQPSSILSVAVMQSQKPLPKNHAQSHWVAAYNHGYYWLVKNKLRQSVLQEEVNAQRNEG